MKNKRKKGEFGYFSYEKKKRILLTAALLAIPVIVFISGWLYHGTRNNVLTVVATVGCLPACKSAVSMVMMLLRKPMKEELYKKIEAHGTDLTKCYEMYVTFYEKSGYFDAFAICGNEVVGYTSDTKVDLSFMEKNIQTIIQKNGYKAHVKIVKDLGPYLERLDSMSRHKDSLEAEVTVRRGEEESGQNRDEIIKQILLAICL